MATFLAFFTHRRHGRIVTSRTLEVMTSGEAARLIGVTAEWLRRRLDDELQPARTSNGTRVYDRARVEEFARRRRDA